MGEQFSNKQRLARIASNKKKKSSQSRKKTKEELNVRRSKVAAQDEKIVKKKEGTLPQGKVAAPITLEAKKKKSILEITPGSTRDNIGKLFGGGANRGFEEGETPILGGSLPLGIPNAAALLRGGEEAVNQIITTTRSGQGGVLGKNVLSAIDKGFNAASTAAKTTQTTARIGNPMVTKIGEMAINTKTIELAKNLMAKFFTKTVTSTNLGTGTTTVTRVASTGAYAATAIAWASSVFLGRWGQSEAPEAILFPIKELIKQAKTPEDWAEVDAHLEIAAEISDVTIWEEIILWSPFSAVEGTISKARGVAEGVKIIAETAIKVREEQLREETQGGSDFDVAQDERDIARDQRDAEFAQSEEDRNTRQDERDAKFTEDQEARDAKEEKETIILQEVFRLRREKKWAEADALELTIYK